MTEKIVNIAKEVVEELCDQNGNYVMYWDYRDEADVESIKTAVKNFKKEGFSNPKDYLEISILDNCFDADQELYEQLQKRVYATGDAELIAEYQNANAAEILEEAGYNGIDGNVDDLLRNTEIDLNIFIATDHEQDRDMGGIIDAFGSYRLPDEVDEDDIDNALSWLVKQQGHKISEVYSCLNENPRGFSLKHKCSFIESVVDEIVNNTSEAMSEVAFLVKLKGADIFDFFTSVTERKSLKLEKNVMCGIFNEWSGCGGTLDIVLEKDVIVPCSMIRAIQFDDSVDMNSGIGNVYGLGSDAWTESASFCDDETVQLKEEDLAEAKATFDILFCE